MQTAIVEYQVATYSGQIEVFNVDENDGNEIVIARAKRQLERTSGPLPYGYQSFRVIERS